MYRLSTLLKKYQATLLAAVLLLPLCGMAAPPIAGKPPLQMGILPYLSAEQLFRFFSPMKNYLEQKLGRTIVMSTAPDFSIYIERARNLDYDIYVTAPHFALLAEQESSYRRVGRMTRSLDAAIFVRKNDPARVVEDLRGRRVARPSKLALASIQGEQILRAHGLVSGRDYELLEALSHNNVLMRVLEQDADAALTSGVVLDRMPASVRDHLRVLIAAPKVPQVMIMASPKLSEADFRSLTQAVLAFTPTGPGKEFFDRTGNLGIVPITQTDMDTLQPFLPILKDRLK